jgi:hypothetical protein
MTTYTLAQLATRVLRDTGLIGSEETPSATDLTWAEETCSAEMDLLAQKGIPLWDAGADVIPQQYLTELSRRIGLAIGPSFGLITLAEAVRGIEVAERNLTLLAAPRRRPLNLIADDAKPRRSGVFNYTSGQ